MTKRKDHFYDLINWRFPIIFIHHPFQYPASSQFILIVLNLFTPAVSSWIVICAENWSNLSSCGATETFQAPPIVCRGRHGFSIDHGPKIRMKVSTHYASGRYRYTQQTFLQVHHREHTQHIVHPESKLETTSSTSHQIHMDSHTELARFLRNSIYTNGGRIIFKVTTQLSLFPDQTQSIH